MKLGDASGKKAAGIDKVTKAEYEEQLEENITNLVERLKNKAYKPCPSLRVFIPKGNGKMRLLGIASYEDKIVQLAVKKILEAVYEPRFLNCMYGFRANRGCHDAIKEVHHRIQNEWINYVVDAERYYTMLKERLERFHLELEESKSRQIEFGRYAESNCKRKGKRKPEIFDFLGFTFYCGKGRKSENFCVKLKTSRKKYAQKLKAMKEWLYNNKDLSVKELIAKLNVKLTGHYRYYGVSFNSYKLGSFLHYTQKYLFKALNRRSQMKSYIWNGFADMLKVYPLAKPKIEDIC